MKTFPFTRRKLLSMPKSRQQKWIAQWLRDIYSSTDFSSLINEQVKQFLNNYKTLLTWTGYSQPDFPDFKNEKDWLEFLSDRFHFHQHETGLGLAETNFLPRIIEGDLLSDEIWIPKIDYRPALDSLRSAFNVGSIFRTSDATGMRSVITGGKTPGKENQQVIKTSMGATDWIPEEKAPELPEFLAAERKKGIPVIGVETVEGSHNYDQFDWPEQGILLLGNEEYGISQSALKECDYYVQLPMVGRKNSINVANCFAVIAFTISASLLNKN